MAFQIPYAYDDWEWGTPTGIEYFVSASVNARYMGNFLEVLFTRNFLFKSIFMGTVFFLIPLLISKFTAAISGDKCDVKSKELSIFILCNILILLVPLELWRQSYGWIAGFSNFVMACLFLTLFLYLIKDFFMDKREDTVNTLKLIPLFIFCILAQLCLENMAVYLVIMSLLILVSKFTRERKVNSKYLTMFVGFIVGLSILLSSSIYNTLVETGEAANGYRRLAFSAEEGIISVFFSITSNFLTDMLCNIYAQGWILLSLMSILMIVKLRNRKESGGAGRLILLHIASVFLLAYNYSIDGNDFATSNTMMAVIRVFISVLHFLLMIYTLNLVYKENLTLRKTLLTVWVSVVGVIVPLGIVDRYDYRLAFTSYILLVIALALVFGELTLEKNMDVTKNINNMGVILLLILVVKYSVVYTSIGKIDRERNRIISEGISNGSGEIVMPYHKYKNYIYGSEPDLNNEGLVIKYKEFFGIDNNVNIRFEEK